MIGPMDDRTYVPAALEYLDPAVLDYGEWAEVGMALHAEGYGADMWDEWSRRDPARFHPGECARKWQSFGNSPSKVAGGTIVQMARERGWTPPRRPWDDGPDEALDWDAPIIDPSWVEPAELPENPWDPVGEAVRYLEAVFEPEDIVGYVTTAFQGDDGRWKPAGKGAYDRTAGQLIAELERTRSIEDALGTANGEAGAWIRFNPLTGAGVRNADVAEFRHALVESDELEPGRQLALMRELELPCSAIVESGGKSVHAIVRVDADDWAEYRRRVDYLYRVCEKHGLAVDTQNKNPSRLSRFPGFKRGEKRQRMLEGRCGKASWAEWVEFVEEAEDGLPDIERFDASEGSIPEAPEPLVEGILNPGDKMMLAGPSKAGKSFALIELCVAIAEGAEWLGRRCRRGRVLYVNLELKRESRIRRMAAVYGAMGIEPAHAGDIHCLDLRGVDVPLDKLTRSIIRRAARNRYAAVVIDPLYKVMGGDESDSEAVKRFCSQIDRLAEGMGCAAVYCHHYSKGEQWQKASIDRASGSGVFARDADTLLAMTGIPLTDAVRKQREDTAVGRACEAYMDANAPGWRDGADADCILAGGDRLVSECRRIMDARRGGRTDEMLAAVMAARQASARETAWRIEGTFRDLPSCKPIDCWFDFPAHHVDATGVLADLTLEGNDWKGKKGRDRRRTGKAERAEMRRGDFDEAYAMCDGGEGVGVKEIAEYLGVTTRTVEARVKEFADSYWLKNGVVGRRPK